MQFKTRREAGDAFDSQVSKTISPCEGASEEEILLTRFDGRCFFYPGRDCKGWVYDGKCGRIGKVIKKEEDLEATPD